MTNDLAAPDDLAEFPGAPFADSLLDAAVSAVRGEVGWHIAPSRNDTVDVDSRGGRYLFLPSLYVTAVTTVEDVTGDVATAIDDWRFSANGTLYRAAGWPAGTAAVRVAMTHGFASCPADLLSVLAERCQLSAVNRAYAREGVGPFSVTLRDRADRAAVDPAVARYQLPGVA